LATVPTVKQTQPQSYSKHVRPNEMKIRFAFPRVSRVTPVRLGPRMLVLARRNELHPRFNPSTVQRFNKSLAHLDEQRRHSTSVRESPLTVHSFFCLLTSCHSHFAIASRLRNAR
jgi:hypothetical protein